MKFNELLNTKINLNKDIDINIIKEYIFKIFAILIFLLPAIPEITDYGIYSLKCTLFNLITLITCICLISTSLYNYIAHKEKINVNIFDVFLAIYLLLVILSCIFTKYGILECILGINGRGEGVLTIFSYIATLIIFSKGFKYIKDTLIFAVIGAVIVFIYSIIEVNLPNGYSIPLAPQTLTHVATGTMRNQNFLSSYVIIFLPMFIYSYLAIDFKSKQKNILSLVFVSMLFATLLFSKTLGGYITFIFMFVVISIFCIITSSKKKNTFKKLAVLCTIFICIFALTNLFIDNSFFNELADSKKEINKIATKDETFGSHRFQIWEKTLMVIKNNMLFGTGPDSLDKELSNLETYLTDGKNDILNIYRIDKAHCEFLHIAATTGIPSLIAYLAVIIPLCIMLLIKVISLHRKTNTDFNAKENENENKKIFITMIFIGIISYLMQGMINISVIQVAPIFWAMLGIGIHIINDGKKSQTLQ